MASARALDRGPLLLALESSSRTPSVALFRGSALLAEVEGAAGRTGAESLLPGVDAVLRQAQLGPAAIEAFAVSIGPGSFTGLRVGVATIKGLAFDTQKPVVAVPTLAALALAALSSVAARGVPVVGLLDARRDEVYAAGWELHEPDGRLRPARPLEGVYTAQALASALPARALLVGEGVAVCGQRARELAGPGVELGPTREPHAREVGLLGQRALSEGAYLSAAELVPRYVRRAEAEVKRTGQRFE